MMRVAFVRECTVHTRCVAALRQDDDQDNSEYYQQRDDNSEHDQHNVVRLGGSSWKTTSVCELEVRKFL